MTLPAKMKAHRLCFFSGQFNVATIFKVSDLIAAGEFILRGASPIYTIETHSALLAHV